MKESAQGEMRLLITRRLLILSILFVGLVALGVKAVATAREEGRRSRCMNNLRESRRDSRWHVFNDGGGGDVLARSSLDVGGRGDDQRAGPCSAALHRPGPPVRR